MIALAIGALVMAALVALIPSRVLAPVVVTAIAAVALAVAAAVAATLPEPVTGPALALVLTGAVLAAATGGVPLVPVVFRLARRQDEDGPTPGVLHGGLVIGVLERLAVAVAIIAGWPEGIAVVLAVKGLARYPELREAHASEHFIIGTFASVLWALAAAGIGVGLAH